jgi:MraZ protein
MSNSARVDHKGRLRIPVILLPILKRSDTEFYITSEDGYSVRIYPMQVWNHVEERLERLCSRNKNSQKLLVRAKYFGQAVTMDKQGRVLIPVVLRGSAQMKGAVDVLDYLSYLEVWNHARFLKNLKGSPMTAQDEEMLNKLSSARRLPHPVNLNPEKGHVSGTERRFRASRQARPDSHDRLTHSNRDSRPQSAARVRAA